MAERYKVSYIIETDMDPSTLLDVAQERANDFQDEIETYGHTSVLDDNDVVVEEV